MKKSLLFLFFFLAAASIARADKLVPHTSWSFHDIQLTPVQSGGRLKPLDSFAREAVLFETGSRAYQGWNPTDLLFSWLAHPTYWQDQTFIQVGREDVRRQLQLDEKRTRFSPRELMENFALAQYADSIMRTQQGVDTQTNPTKDKNDPRTRELKQLLDRIGLFRSVVAGTAWLVVPVVGSTDWTSLAGNEPAGEPVRSQFVSLIKSYLAEDATHFAEASHSTREAVQKAAPHFNPSTERTLQAEQIFNQARPFLWAWIFYLVASLLWIITIWTPTLKSLKPAAMSATVLAAIFHVGGMALRCYVAGRPPVTNMYESVIWVSFGQLAFAAILYFMQRQAVVLAVATALATFGLIAGDAAPAILDPSIQPLVPVLRSNYWLTIHVLTITLGYAAFALTLGLADVTLFNFIKEGPGIRTRIQNLNQLTYRAMQFGVVLIAAGTILGGIWADYSWGRFWGWDPKEVWALIVLLSYIIILHARFTGWMQQFGYAAWTVIAFLSVLMAWYGVNFVLGVGLHSYGFSTGGRGAVAGFVLAQLIYVGVIAVIKKRREMSARAAV